MFRKFIFLLFGIPFITFFTLLSFILYIISCGKINFKFWEKNILYSRYHSNILYFLFSLFICIDVIILSFIYLYYPNKIHPIDKDIHWGDIDNNLIYTQSDNKWNYNITNSKNHLSVIQDCPSGSIHSVYLLYCDKILGKMIGKENNNFYEYDIIVNGVKELHMKTTNGMPGIIDEESFYSMIGYDLRGNRSIYVKWTSFPSNKFFVKNIYGDDVVSYENKDGKWEIKSYGEENVFSPVAASIYLGHFIVLNKDLISNDMCNITYSLIIILLSLSILVFIFLVIGYCIYRKNYLQSNYLYTPV